MKKFLIILISLLILIIPSLSLGDDKSDNIIISIRYLPFAFIEYEGEGARTTEYDTWENKVKSHNPVTEIELDYALTQESSINFKYLTNFSTIDYEASSSGLQYNDVIMKVRNFSTHYIRSLENSNLKGIFGLQHFQQVFQRSNFFLYPDEEIDFNTKEVIKASGLNFGVTGRYFSPVYFDFEFISGIMLHTTNRQTSDSSTLDCKGYTYRLKLETGVDFGDFTAGIGALRELYHPQVKGGASTDDIVYSYSQNKTDLMGFYLFATYNY